MGDYTSLRRGDADRSNLHDDAVGQIRNAAPVGGKRTGTKVGADEARSTRTPRCVSVEFAVYSALTDSPWRWEYAFNVCPCRRADRRSVDSRFENQ